MVFTGVNFPVSKIVLSASFKFFYRLLSQALTQSETLQLEKFLKDETFLR